MNIEEFEKIVEKRIAFCKEVLSEKKFDYSTGGDRLGNFKAIARLLDCTPKEALLGLMAKHIVTMVDYIRRVRVSPDRVSREQWDSVNGDIINYIYLLDGLIEEGRSGSTKPH